MPRADLLLGVLAASSAAFGLALAAFWRSRAPAPVTGRRAAWVLVALVLAWAAVAALSHLQALGIVRGFDAPALLRLRVYLICAQALVFLLLTASFQRPVLAAGLAKAIYILPAGWLLAGIVISEAHRALPDPLFTVGSAAVTPSGAAYAWLLAGWLGCTAAAAARIAIEYHRHRAPLHRNRTHYWTAALLLLLIGQLLALSGDRLVVAARAATAPLLMLGTLAAFFAVTNHYLPDLRSAARVFAIYAVLVLVVFGLYALGFAALVAFLPLAGEPARQQGIAIGAVLALLLTLILYAPVSAIARLLRRLFSGAGYDPRRALAEYSATISSILDLELLSTIAVGLISEALEISRGALVTVEPLAPTAAPEAAANPLDPPTLPRAGYRLRPISGMGEALAEGLLPPTSPAAESLRRERRPLTQFDLDLHPAFAALSPAERAWWSSLGMDLFVPIYVKETWTGLLALGPKLSGDRYFENDLAFVQTLADQTAVALENARLFDHLKSRNTENERLNAELTAANLELSRLDQAKSNFINIASHELRTPLTQIMGYNDILSEMVRSDGSLPSDAPAMTDAVRKAARRLEEIVNTMFDVSKLDTRTLDLHLEPVSLPAAIAAAGEVWRAGMEERGLRLAQRGLESLPTIHGDAKRLTQVFANLIQNAVRATPDGGLITVSGRYIDPQPGEEPPTGWVELIVADTGIGIAAEELERIFERFYRVGSVLLHSTGETKFKGAGPGLGLAVARGIVEAHGGRIWAESPGRDETACPGARFYVLLPVHTASSP